MKPLELSQGEQQRVAIARALVKRPKVLLADEPTGNLDSENSENIMRIFREIADNNQTILMITHNRNLAAMTDRIVEMKDGRALESGSIDLAGVVAERLRWSNTKNSRWRWSRAQFRGRNGPWRSSSLFCATPYCWLSPEPLPGWPRSRY
jgi:energy-coupling factor transporter ATP-binding protein EcfA2